MTCHICGNAIDNQYHLVSEMMFGLREQFQYLECGACGCLQISEIPSDLARYYPQDFYSFQALSEPKAHPIETFLRRQRMQLLLKGNQTLGMLLSKILRKTFGIEIPEYYYHDWFQRIHLSADAKILDVGCGSGNLLLNMQLEGFTDLTGIDPFIDHDIVYQNGVKVLKKTVHELEGTFDFVMLNHSFEHMPQPLTVLKELYRLLKPDRYALIRTPVADSFAWRKYRVNWVAIDAPRHLYIHTPKSIQQLAKQAGFELKQLFFDSHAYQFWASEQILKDIAVRESQSHAVNPKASIFSQQEMAEFTAQSISLNQAGEGDAAGFYLYKPNLT
ncbi:class I SAM-dependent methyltransferase [Phormidesmis sp. 146-12]